VFFLFIKTVKIIRKYNIVFLWIKTNLHSSLVDLMMFYKPSILERDPPLSPEGFFPFFPVKDFFLSFGSFS